MFHFHFRDGFGHAARFIGVVFRRLSRGHGAKRATARTHISQNHKGSRSRPPTFAHVWTVAAFANGMQLVFIHQSPHIRIRLARRKFYAQPIGLARFYFCDCGFHFFTFQSVFYTRPLSAKKRFLLSHWKAQFSPANLRHMALRLFFEGLCRGLYSPPTLFRSTA